jgi:cystathionine beta-synthase
MNFDVVDDYVRVTDRESMLMTRRLSAEEGLFVGGSSGMAIAGALQWLRAHRAELHADDVVVVLAPDSGYRYLSKIFNDAWMQNHGFLGPRTELTATAVLEGRADPSRKVILIDADQPVGKAIELMAQNGISQMPVSDGRDVVGSLTESDILSRLISEPESKQKPVREVMSKPFPVVPRTMPVDQLSSYLNGDLGAVLVRSDDDDQGYDIITKTDLISALVQIGRKERN